MSQLIPMKIRKSYPQKKAISLLFQFRARNTSIVLDGKYQISLGKVSHHLGKKQLNQSAIQRLLHQLKLSYPNYFKPQITFKVRIQDQKASRGKRFALKTLNKARITYTHLSLL